MVNGIGDTTCAHNAKSPYLRCAINPCGPCEGCGDYSCDWPLYPHRCPARRTLRRRLHSAIAQWERNIADVVLGLGEGALLMVSKPGA